MPYSDQIKYKGLSASGDCSDRDAMAESLLDQIILASDISFSEEEVEQEIRMELAGFMQTMRYQAMGGNHQLEEIDLDEWKKDIRKEIIRDLKVKTILSAVIEQEQLTVSYKELEEAAIRLAEKEQTTLEMVRRFMGEDYALLRKETLFDKAKKIIVDVSFAADKGEERKKNTLDFNR